MDAVEHQRADLWGLALVLVLCMELGRRERECSCDEKDDPRSDGNDSSTRPVQNWAVHGAAKLSNTNAPSARNRTLFRPAVEPAA